MCVIYIFGTKLELRKDLARLEEQHRDLAQVEVDEVPGEVRSNVMGELRTTNWPSQTALLITLLIKFRLAYHQR